MHSDQEFLDREFLTCIRDALDAGAAGIVIGRNIWHYLPPRQGPSSPTAMTQALVALVHHDVSVDDEFA